MQTVEYWQDVGIQTHERHVCRAVYLLHNTYMLEAIPVYLLFLQSTTVDTLNVSLN